MGITTYNPTTLEVTNRWVYSDVISLQPLPKSGNANNEFQICMKKQNKIDNMRFSCDHRTQLLTEALKYRNNFAEKPKEILVSIMYKLKTLLFSSLTFENLRIYLYFFELC